MVVAVESKEMKPTRTKNAALMAEPPPLPDFRGPFSSSLPRAVVFRNTRRLSCTARFYSRSLQDPGEDTEYACIFGQFLIGLNSTRLRRESWISRFPVFRKVSWAAAAVSPHNLIEVVFKPLCFHPIDPQSYPSDAGSQTARLSRSPPVTKSLYFTDTRSIVSSTRQKCRISAPRSLMLRVPIYRLSLRVQHAQTSLHHSPSHNCQARRSPGARPVGVRPPRRAQRPRPPPAVL